MTVWAIIAAGVVAAEAFSRATGCPTPSAEARAHLFVTLTAGTYVLGHLTGWLPPRFDVLRGLR